MKFRTETLPKRFHDAVLKWRETYLPDYDLLLQNWERFFPREPRFQLCAFRECGMCGEIEVGDQQGENKHERATQMDETIARQLLGAVRAQASTEFGSIQQHQLTLARAQTEEDQFWCLRMMAEELRHGYQMFHLLHDDEDWADIAGVQVDDMIDEVLSMKTGSHILAAFNVAFDSFVDNVVFCALIDRVGKYQLAMQQISAYKPMAESMPPMLREEAFHLAMGVVPLRRWAAQAGVGEVTVTMDMIQKAVFKWAPRACEMFGDERGGNTNVRWGLKPMNNAKALDQFYKEIDNLVRDLNHRYVRARLPKLDREETAQLVQRVLQDGDPVQGIRHEDLIRLPKRNFFRRRGMHAFEQTDVDGQPIADTNEYLRYLSRTLPESYLAGRDFLWYVDSIRKVESGEWTPEKASMDMPELSRVGGVCPCARSVRWVLPEGNGSNGNHPPVTGS